jgi:hypothetical protein
MSKDPRDNRRLTEQRDPKRSTQARQESINRKRAREAKRAIQGR